MLTDRQILLLSRFAPMMLELKRCGIGADVAGPRILANIGERDKCDLLDAITQAHAMGPDELSRTVQAIRNAPDITEDEIKAWLGGDPTETIQFSDN